jgi:hypothetical protein
MDSKRVTEIALEVCNLFQQQLDAIKSTRLDELSAEKREAYARRAKKISELRAELQRYIKPI